MGDTKPSCRLAVLFAAESRKAIIFRHGPAKQTRLIAWDRGNDTFEPGQWMRRTRVYDERSAISPDGEYLLLFLGTFRPPFQTYTVLSRPPYFTALALWPKGDTWGGGGSFAGDRAIVLDHFDTALAPGFEMPWGFRVDLAESGAEALLARLRAHREPDATWTKCGGAARWTKRDAGGLALRATSRQVAEFETVLEYAVVSDTREVPLPGARWADFDTSGDVVFAIGGGLYRLRRGDIAEALARGDAVAPAKRLADFTEMRFEAIVAPYSPGNLLDDPKSFSPRLDRVTREDRRRRVRARKAERRGDKG